MTARESQLLIMIQIGNEQVNNDQYLAYFVLMNDPGNKQKSCHSDQRDGHQQHII